MLGSERYQFLIVPAESPLTLALSQRERGLIEVLGQGTPTCDTELCSGQLIPDTSIGGFDAIARS